MPIKQADRIPVTDSPWNATIERWQREGMPTDHELRGLLRPRSHCHDPASTTPANTRERVLEPDTNTPLTLYTSRWGATQKEWRHAASTPEFLDFTVVEPPASWAEAKARIPPPPDRIDWAHLEQNYPIWKQKGYWLRATLWFGFDVTHSWIVGTERMLFALSDNPEWCMDMFSHMLEVNLNLLDMVWDAGYQLVSVFWWDDMGYKHSQFFSLRMYAHLLKPFHQRAIEWAHAKGIKAYLHSCGDVNLFVPELVGLGLDALNPLEVKGGINPVHLKQTYGNAPCCTAGSMPCFGTSGTPSRQRWRKVIARRQGGWRLYLLIGSFCALQRQPGGFPAHYRTGKGTGGLLTHPSLCAGCAGANTGASAVRCWSSAPPAPATMGSLKSRPCPHQKCWQRLSS